MAETPGPAAFQPSGILAPSVVPTHHACRQAAAAVPGKHFLGERVSVKIPRFLSLWRNGLSGLGTVRRGGEVRGARCEGTPKEATPGPAGEEQQHWAGKSDWQEVTGSSGKAFFDAFHAR